MTQPTLARTTADGRHYPHPITGTDVPSITTVTSIVTHPALERWYAKRTVTAYLDGARGNVKRALDIAFGSNEASERGDRVHGAIEAALTGVQPDEPLRSPAEEQMRDRALGLVREWRLDPVGVEVTRFGLTESGDGYAGTADLIALQDGELIVLDWKTGRLHAAAALQGAALCHAAYDASGRERPLPVRSYAVGLGSNPRRVASPKNPERAWRVFSALVDAWYWRQDEHAALVGIDEMASSW